MMVWLVIDDQIEANVPIAIFTTKKRAKSFMKKVKDASRYDSLAIEKFELDTEP